MKFCWKNKSIFIFFILISFNLTGQTIITGKVYSGQNNPISNIRIIFGSVSSMYSDTGGIIKAEVPNNYIGNEVMIYIDGGDYEIIRIDNSPYDINNRYVVKNTDKVHFLIEIKKRTERKCEKEKEILYLKIDNVKKEFHELDLKYKELLKIKLSNDSLLNYYENKFIITNNLVRDVEQLFLRTDSSLILYEYFSKGESGYEIPHFWSNEFDFDLSLYEKFNSMRDFQNARQTLSVDWFNLVRLSLKAIDLFYEEEYSESNEFEKMFVNLEYIPEFEFKEKKGEKQIRDSKDVLVYGKTFIQAILYDLELKKKHLKYH